MTTTEMNNIENRLSEILEGLSSILTAVEEKKHTSKARKKKHDQIARAWGDFNEHPFADELSSTKMSRLYPMSVPYALKMKAIRKALISVNSDPSKLSWDAARKLTDAMSI
jgi:hypothetical protein